MLRSKIFKVLATIGIITSAIFAQNDGDTKTITAGGTSIEVVFVKAGSFWTESGRRITLTESFWIGKYPITQVQYEAVMGNNPSFFSGNPNNPVEQITWNNANGFAVAVGGFLPTEAQWEFAARGGNKSEGYTYSGSDDLNEVGWYRTNRLTARTQPVGQLKPNELGIYDMSGNVFEWAADWLWHDYPSSDTNPKGPNHDGIWGAIRVNRGGSWSSNEDACQVFCRNGSYPGDYDYHGNRMGFRVAFPAQNNTAITQTASKKPTSFSIAGMSNGQVNLQLQAGNYTAELYNLQGRLIGKTEITATNGINATGLRVDNLSNGIFILNVKQEGVSVLSGRISVR